MSKYETYVSERKIPIIIGIAGHMDLRSEEERTILKAKTKEIFGEFRKNYPNTPLTVMTSLARGADILAAEAAIEESIPIICPLALPKDEFINDFDGFPEEKERFDLCLSHAENQELFVGWANGVAAENCREQDMRDLQYERQGRYVSNYCNILVAFWNSAPPSESAGTSVVVDYTLRDIAFERSEEIKEIGIPETRPVYQIVTPRQKDNGAVPENAFSVNKYYCPIGHCDEECKAAKAAFKLKMSRIEQYNRDVCKYKRWLKRLETKEYKKEDSITTLISSDAELFLMNHYLSADGLSVKQKKERNTVFKIGLVIVIISSICLGLSVNQSSILFLILLSAAFLFLKFFAGAVNKQKRHEKFVDYRAMAECLRVQIYWNHIGIDKQAQNYMLKNQKYMLDWVQSSVRNIVYIDSVKNTASKESEENVNASIRHWVDGQIKYFGDKLKVFDKKHKPRGFLLSLTENLTYITPILLAVLMYVNEQVVSVPYFGYITSAASVLLVVFPYVSIWLFGEKELEKVKTLKSRYSWDLLFFRAVSEQIEQVKQEKDRQARLAKLETVGAMEIVETGNWASMVRFDTPELPNI
ncbi:MAG: hypothetical protein LBL82_07255 [Oscillospiraceae bacterium]|nr:hypothetical protein [Oscillospiraceae bacterium]